MIQYTIRTQSPELEAKLRELAKERGWSLNQAANYFLRKGADLLDESATKGIGSGVDKFIGSWPAAEAEAFDQRIAEECESVEEDLWQ